MSRRRIGWVAMVVVLLGVFAVALTDDGGPTTPEARAQRIAESLMCPSCLGQSVADSDSSASRGIRIYIDQRIDEGATDGEIRDELAQTWGDDILLTPERSGLVGLIWVLPVAVLMVALAGIALAFRRWRGQAVGRASAADRELVGRALDEMHAEPTRS